MRPMLIFTVGILLVAFVHCNEVDSDWKHWHNAFHRAKQAGYKQGLLLGSIPSAEWLRALQDEECSGLSFKVSFMGNGNEDEWLALEHGGLRFEKCQHDVLQNGEETFDLIVMLVPFGHSGSKELFEMGWKRLARGGMLLGRMQGLGEISQLLDEITGQSSEFALIKNHHQDWMFWQAVKSDDDSSNNRINSSSSISSSKKSKNSNHMRPIIKIMKPLHGVSIPLDIVDPTADEHPKATTITTTTVGTIVNCTNCDLGPDSNFLRVSVGEQSVIGEQQDISFHYLYADLGIGSHTVTAELFDNNSTLIAKVEHEFNVTAAVHSESNPTPYPGIDHVFVCHWPPLVDRKQHIESSLSNLGFNLERDTTWITKYDRSSMSPDFVASIYDGSFDAWLSRWLWMNPGKGLWPPHRNMSLGEIGVTMCHVDAYGQMAQRGIRSAMIIEDDAVFVHDFADVWDNYWNQLPNDWDFFMVGLGDYQYANTHCGPMKEGEHVCKKSHPASRTAGAYMINNKACVQLQSSMRPFACVSDCELQFQMFVNDMNVYWAHPHLVFEGTKGGPFSSVVQPDRDKMQAIAIAREDARKKGQL